MANQPEKNGCQKLAGTIRTYRGMRYRQRLEVENADLLLPQIGRQR